MGGELDCHCGWNDKSLESGEQKQSFGKKFVNNGVLALFIFCCYDIVQGLKDEKINQKTFKKIFQIPLWLGPDSMDFGVDLLYPYMVRVFYV